MAEIRLTRVEQGQTKIKNVPIAVTPEGFWCCPSPAVFQKTIKTQNPVIKPKSSLTSSSSNPQPQTSTIHKKQTSVSSEKKPATSLPKPCPDNIHNEEQKNNDSSDVNAPPVNDETPTSRPKPDNVPRKVMIEFGEPGTSDLKVVLLGKQGVAMKLSAHRNVLVENSHYFTERIPENQLILPFVEIEDCEDVEIYVETIGLMYCKELKPKLIKQSVSRVLRILKASEKLGFTACMESCLEYLEAVPWVGQDEEEKVVSLLLSLKGGNINGIKPVLKRVSSNIPNPPKDTLSYILDLVLKSTEEKGRREMKSIVIKLLRENNNNSNNLPSSSNSSDSCIETIYNSCTSSLNSLVSIFKEASENPDLIENSVLKSMALEADNLTWLFDILADKQAAEDFALTWANQQELASLHDKLPIVSRHYVSIITSRIFVRIGRGELLPCKDTRLLLLNTWLQPLINDYNWLQHGSRSFDRKVVEEGIGQTILTLPLEDQQSLLLSWLGCFLNVGDGCPNLQTAFEVWWRRTFVRPYVETVGSVTERDTC